MGKSTKRANDLSGSEWIRYSISVWNDIRKSPEESKIAHPAMFPTMLVERLIRCFTKPEDKYVLDPFAGSGAVLIAARNLGRVGIGFEINEEFIRIAQNRLAQHILFDTRQEQVIHQMDARRLREKLAPNSVHLCITSPPYWDILSQKRTADYKEIRNYGDHENDLSRIRDYATFLEELTKVFSAVYDVLLPGKYCIVDVMDIRKKDRLYPLHMDLAQRMQHIGFMFDDVIIWDRRQEYNNLRSLGYPYVFRLNRIHEYLLVFLKPTVPRQPAT
jgi:DNA modification methylase